MNLSEAAVLVAVIVTYDNRTNDDMTDQVWQTALHDVDLPDAVAAVHAHFRESTAPWLMPAMVRDRVRKIRRDRLELAGQPDLPTGLDQIAERRWAKAWRNAIAAGASREEATAATDRAAGIVREIETPRPVAQLLAGSGFGKSVAS